MKERPILFSGAMVRAILDGSKTQTRRVVKSEIALDWLDGTKFTPEFVASPENNMCKYGKIGDRLWVRETWGVVSFDFDHLGDLVDWKPDREAKPINELKFGNGYYTGHAIYRADGEFNWCDDYQNEISAWKPSIHMPRFISRITLEIVNIRVERLNDISEEDAQAEGVIQLEQDDTRPEEHTNDGWKICPRCCGTGLHSGLGPNGGVVFDIDCRDCDTHKKLFKNLWESINGAESWALNPWVWVIEFRRVS